MTVLYAQEPLKAMLGELMRQLLGLIILNWGGFEGSEWSRRWDLVSDATVAMAGLFHGIASAGAGGASRPCTCTHHTFALCESIATKQPTPRHRFRAVVSIRRARFDVECVSSTSASLTPVENKQSGSHGELSVSPDKNVVSGRVESLSSSATGRIALLSLLLPWSREMFRAEPQTVNALYLGMRFSPTTFRTQN